MEGTQGSHGSSFLIRLGKLFAATRSQLYRLFVKLLFAIPPVRLLWRSYRALRRYIDDYRFKMSEEGDMEYHKGFMRVAIEMAGKALNSDETPVGCVFVHKRQIIGRGMNFTNDTLNGTRHCELVAIGQILQKHPPSILKETDLYVTVEPCIMCASALRQLGIRAVYFGCFNDRFGGTGGILKIHQDPSVDPPYPATPGIYREDAIMLLRRFYIQENGKAPEPKQKKTRELKTDILPLQPNGPALVE